MKLRLVGKAKHVFAMLNLMAKSYDLNDRQTKVWWGHHLKLRRN